MPETPTPAVPNATPPPKVAVIAVHGVAYHAPGASANAMADLLLSLPSAATSPPGTPRLYTAFQRETIQIPLQPVQVWTYPLPRPTTWFGRFFGFLQEASANFASYLGYWVRSTGVPAAPGAVGNEFMRLLLRDYPGGADRDFYDTARLRAKRTATTPGGEAEVDIYEAYWADLARPKNTLLSFFFALFQLLLHVGSLSRLAIDAGAAENPGRAWHAFRAIQEYAVRILQIPIPLLNLILLIAAFSVFPSQFPAEQNKTLALVLAGLLGLAAGFLVSRKPTLGIPGGPLRWAALPAIFAAGGVLIGYALLSAGVAPIFLAAIESWGIGAALFLAVLKKYDDIRDGTKESGLALYVLALLAFLVALAMRPDGEPPVALQQATLWTMQWLLAALRLSWILLFVFAFLALILGSRAWRRLPKGSPQQARARAAVRTSRLALALPSLLLLLIIIFLWGGLFHWATHTALFPHPLFDAGIRPTLAPGGNFLKSLFFNPADIPGMLAERPVEESHSGDAPRLSCAAGHCIPEPPPSRHQISPDNYFAGYLVWSIGPGLAITLVLMIAGFFLLAWWALPSVLTEKFPLRNEHAPPRWSTNQESLHMGIWTSRGLDAMAFVTALMWSAIFLVPTLFAAWPYLEPHLRALAMMSSCIGSAWNYAERHLPSIAAMNLWTDSIIGQTGKLTASLTLLGLIVRSTSSALGIVLDVDNYLRTSPKNATPRAKIVERYVSLLRYIAKPEHGYTRVVIVAHSLGALISGDLLRFLHEEKDASLERLGYGPSGNAGEIPITLFTMGNPARQFLNRFFPYLYDWVNPVPSGSLHPFGPATLDAPAAIAPDALPDPAELGVQRWVSAYRSGDYVGRSLWTEEWYGRNLNGPAQGTPDEPIHIVRQAPLPAPSPREEMCNGAGAHQHYWDDTATDIAERLNVLI